MNGIFIGLGIIALCVAAFATVNHIIVRELMKIALDRQEPRLMTKGKERLMRSKDLEATLKQLSYASESLCASECKEISILSHDGIKLAGHWRECKNAKRIIVAMHGWRSTWCQDFGAIADFWYESGCSVLYAEQRAQGNSDGEYMGFGLLERYDCIEWLKKINELNKNSLPVYLAGISMGATTVLMSAGLELPIYVSGIIADCAFTSPLDIWKHVVVKNLHLPYDIYNRKVLGICKKKLSINEMGYSCTDALNKCTVPVLFIHGASDAFVPVEMTYKNYQACKSEKQLLVVPGADHGMSYIVDQGKYEHTIKKFWNKYDSQKNNDTAASSVQSAVELNA